nr:immunoglobulin heavy chain junction region [Macaca mulatta]MOW76318.1 immunoglobulin heavy chain junction region [Macaca mulatta]MOW78262.1 immunoglobulin heavy chain junction region [Macaca mulatta]MOW79598.1 immunoglobulin heavy chain junction region [Macaca mulatta]MOW80024.1 immunoglobulin heavy chain junction region [Macaca mulatta]
CVRGDCTNADCSSVPFDFW